jgi:hypothetical protein
MKNSKKTSNSLLAGINLKEKLKWVNTSGFIHPIVAKNKKDMAVVAQTLLITLSVTAERSSFMDVLDTKTERLMGQNTANLHHSLSN